MIYSAFLKTWQNSGTFKNFKIRGHKVNCLSASSWAVSFTANEYRLTGHGLRST